MSKSLVPLTDLLESTILSLEAQLPGTVALRRALAKEMTAKAGLDAEPPDGDGEPPLF